jgi:hypothetical protein
MSPRVLLEVPRHFPFIEDREAFERPVREFLVETRT